ncbi:1-acyl-sn-glycerol-3-phosphate acyltransferase, partial [Georgenia sp. 10Sc9-8]|nr:1-acyl-sn-glycerol-3-phosphate acyltransferase [Georgenia halotolerans]
YVPPPRADLHVVFGPPLDLRAEPGATGRQAVAHAMTAISEGLVAHVTDAVARTGVALPVDDGMRPGSPGAAGTGQ